MQWTVFVAGVAVVILLELVSSQC